MKQINAYLNFDGDCREAMTFYSQCLEADLHMMPFSDMPGQRPPGTEDRIMHAALAKGPAMILMASDTAPGELRSGNNFWLNIQCDSLDEIERLFGALGEGGTVKMPLHDAFWGARFGMLTDRFGINWMFNYELKKA
jgi:PhnB protein